MDIGHCCHFYFVPFGIVAVVWTTIWSFFLSFLFNWTNVWDCCQSKATIQEAIVDRMEPVLFIDWFSQDGGCCHSQTYTLGNSGTQWTFIHRKRGKVWQWAARLHAAWVSHPGHVSPFLLSLQYYNRTWSPGVITAVFFKQTYSFSASDTWE
jgi:hypothetical protein